MLTEEQKRYVQSIAHGPAFDAFANDVIDDLDAAILAIQSIEKAESRVQEETCRVRATQAITDAMAKFREVMS